MLAPLLLPLPKPKFLCCVLFEEPWQNDDDDGNDNVSLGGVE
jgi:hypothetical protein